MHYNMGYPREQALARPPGQMNPKGRSATHGQLDPDELSRRLYIVLAEQKAHSERKRRARGDGANTKAFSNGSGEKRPPKENSKAPPFASGAKIAAESKPVEASTSLATGLHHSKSSKLNARGSTLIAGRTDVPSNGADEPAEYRHVPKEAAKQFARTTTVDSMQSSGLVHKFSKQALKLHLNGVKANRNPAGESKSSSAGKQHGTSQRREQSGKENVIDRMLEVANEIDDERRREAEEKQRHRHTFEGELSRLRERAHETHNAERRNSTGDLLDKTDGNANRRSLNPEQLMDIMEDMTPPGEPDATQAHEHRVDWTQSDETRHRPRLLLSPLLRKADSIWTLRGRLGSKGSQDRVESPQDRESPIKSPKSGFFAKFQAVARLFLALNT